MRKIIIIFILFANSIFNITQLFSEEVSMTSEEAESVQEEIRWLRAEAMVSVTTKDEIPISKASGIVIIAIIFVLLIFA